ncbi:hypothetical protein COU60_03575 [Candidatus Pacearchaeota archaeon CG10_big_fil_rev_8_21_14_0_10_34_76]|nr:MAG: hypothetical protein COU60_03575 [Candidatus Pacearchaeota archaeon CG10_big_fil_rev_8_21_14_0_10_34_76]
MNLRETALEWRIVDPYNPVFITHLNYIKCFKKLSDGLNVESNRLDKSNKKANKKLISKISLIKLIKKSLDREYKACQESKDFAEVSSIWVPVKAYYLVFNLFLVLDYLISPGNHKNFNISHKSLTLRIKELIRKSELIFNKSHFNHLYTYEEVKDVKFDKGENLREEQDTEKLTKRLIKKLIEYKIEEFKRENKIKDLRKKKERLKLSEYLSKELTNLFELFYLFRIKTNYRDLDFLKEDVGSTQFYNYFENYYLATINFYEVLKSLINELSQKRFNEELIK